MNILWMVIVGGMLGMITSVFVEGSRGIGLVWPILIGILSYGLSAIVVSWIGGPILAQWLWAIGTSAVALTAYILLMNWRIRRRTKADALGNS